jgi:hypothetical protein
LREREGEKNNFSYKGDYVVIGILMNSFDCGKKQKKIISQTYFWVIMCWVCCYED